MIVLFILSNLLQVYTECPDSGMFSPIAEQDGDYIVAGIFNIGRVKGRTVVQNGRNTTVQYCDLSNVATYGLQRALVLRWAVELQQDKFRAFNKTIGYKIYSTCRSYIVADRVAMEIANDPKVIGVSGTDYANYMYRTAAITTSTYIPTFVYMFNDDELLTTYKYPTLFSMIDTEKVEAQMMISFLKEMGYTYMDIWYHPFSAEMANYIKTEYLDKLEEGCGRIQQIWYPSDFGKMQAKYIETGGTPADVQLLLGNSGSTVSGMLKYLINEMGFRNKVYIFGMSVGRRSYHKGYTDILRENVDDVSNETLVFPLSRLLNTKLGGITTELSEAWTRPLDRKIDELYHLAQGSKCTKKHPNGTSYIDCLTTSWTGFIAAGVMLILEALRDVLATNYTDCTTRLRKDVYNTIIDPLRMVPITLGPGTEMEFNFNNQTSSLPFEIEVYQTSTNQTHVIGKTYYDRMDVKKPVILSAITYAQTCSHPCVPGTKMKYVNRKAVSCCYGCIPCEGQTFNNKSNTEECIRCDEWEEVYNNATGCRNVIIISITIMSPYFIVGFIVVFLSLVMVFVLGRYINNNEQRPVIKASGTNFLYLLLLSISLGIFTSLTPMMRPSVSICTTEYLCFVAFASMVTSILAWRCINIYSVFTAAKNFERPKFKFLLSSKGMICLNVGLLFTNLTLAIIVQSVGPGGWTFKEVQPYDHSPKYHVCDINVPLSLYLVILPIIIPLVLFLSTLVLCFKMRHIPHNFRETSNIFTATMVVLFTCIMFLSGYSLSPPSIQPVLRAIVIYMTCIAFFVCIFVPKIVVLVKKVDLALEKEEMQRNLKKFSMKDSLPATSTGKVEAYVPPATSTGKVEVPPATSEKKEYVVNSCSEVQGQPPQSAVMSTVGDAAKVNDAAATVKKSFRRKGNRPNENSENGCKV